MSATKPRVKSRVEPREAGAKATIDLREKFRSYEHGIAALAFDHSGTRLAIASVPDRSRELDPSRGYHVDPPQAPRIWIVEVPSGAILHEIELPTQFTDAELGDVVDEGMEMSAEALGAVVLNFSPDGAWLAVGWIVGIDILDDLAGALAFIDPARGVVTRVGAAYSSAGNNIHGALGVGDEGFGGIAAAFAPNSSRLVTAWVMWRDEALMWCSAAAGGWRIMDENDEKRSLEVTPGARVAFSANGRRLVVADASGVKFVDVASRKVVGKSRGDWHVRSQGPLVVAPDGLSALGVSNVEAGAHRASSRGESGRGVWRWRPGTAPERLAEVPEAFLEGDDHVLWVDPRGREVLWADGASAELVRQHIGQSRLTRPRPSPAVIALRASGWRVVVASPDGKRIARARDDGLVLLTRLRRGSD